MMNYIFILTGLFFLLILRVIKGPSVSDTMLAVEVMGNLAICILGLFALYKGYGFLMDVVLVIVLANFLVVVGFGKYLELKNGKDQKKV